MKFRMSKEQKIIRYLSVALILTLAGLASIVGINMHEATAIEQVKAKEETYGHTILETCTDGYCYSPDTGKVIGKDPLTARIMSENP